MKIVACIVAFLVGAVMLPLAYGSAAVLLIVGLVFSFLKLPIASWTIAEEVITKLK